MHEFEGLKSLVDYKLAKYYQGKQLVKAQKQAHYELKVIQELGAIEYLVDVYAYVNLARKYSIPTGPGRAPSTSSIINYILGITQIDPLKYDLICINLFNTSHPHIAVDVCAERRSEILDYVWTTMGIKNPPVVGLRILSIIRQCEKYIQHNHFEHFDISKIPLNDKKTYQLLQAGDTTGCFKLGDKGIQALLRKITPHCVEDLAAVFALHQPKLLELGIVDQFIKSKNGTTKKKRIFKELKPYLAETYGLILYREQWQHIGHIFGGLSYIDTQKFWRMLILIRDETQIKKYKDNFLRNAQAQGLTLDKAECIFRDCVYFAPYTFSKADAIACALLAYRSAYLKANYPTEYMAALIDTNKYLTPEIRQECYRLGISIAGYSELLEEFVSADTCITIKPLGKNIYIDYVLPG